MQLLPLFACQFRLAVRRKLRPGRHETRAFRPFSLILATTVICASQVWSHEQLQRVAVHTQLLTALRAGQDSWTEDGACSEGCSGGLSPRSAQLFLSTFFEVSLSISRTQRRVPYGNCAVPDAPSLPVADRRCAEIASETCISARSPPQHPQFSGYLRPAARSILSAPRCIFHLLPTLRVNLQSQTDDGVCVCVKSI